MFKYSEEAVTHLFFFCSVIIADFIHFLFFDSAHCALFLRRPRYAYKKTPQTIFIKQSVEFFFMLSFFV